MISLETLPDLVGRFVAAQSLSGYGPGIYRYGPTTTRPTLYSPHATRP